MSDPGDSESVSQDRGSYMGRENPMSLGKDVERIGANLFISEGQERRTLEDRDPKEKSWEVSDWSSRVVRGFGGSSAWGLRLNGKRGLGGGRGRRRRRWGYKRKHWGYGDCWNEANKMMGLSRCQ